MATFLDDNELDNENEDQPAPRIARPQASAIPPVTARGLGAPAGSTEDLESRGLASHLGPRPISASTPSPLEEKTAGDQKELARLESTGSGISQIKNPVARGAARGLNTVGEVASAIFPQTRTALRAIPGTEEHHQQLIGKQAGLIGQDEAQQNEESKRGLEQAQTTEATAAGEKDAAQAAAAGRPQPKEEKWSEFAGWTDNDGTPLIREENSGQVLRASDKKPPTGFKAAKPEAQKNPIKITRVVNGVPHEVLVDEHGNDIKDEGQTKVPGESPQDKRDAAQSAQVEREARGEIRKAETQYRETQRQAHQIIASIDASQDGNGLLTSFVPTMEVLGINMGGKVRRISPAEAQAANLPGGWMERWNAYFDKAATGKLSPELQKEGKQLANLLVQGSYEQYKNTYADNAGIVAGYGGKGFDKRVPLIQPEQGGGPSQHGTGPKVISQATIEKAAKDNEVSIDEARRQAEAQGYTIQ